MAEKVTVRQNSAFETLFWYADTDQAPDAPLEPVARLYDVTPYGMLLASLGSCTALVMHTYAQAHELALDEVELRLTYDRVYRKDCRDCEQDQDFEEAIKLEIVVAGRLSAGERKRLLRAAHLCPIHKILYSGIAVSLQMLDKGATLTPLEHAHHHPTAEHGDHD